MSLRLGLLAAAGAVVFAAQPASAGFSFSFSAAQSGMTNPLTVPSGGNAITFDSSAGPGTFSVANTGLYSTFGYALGDYLSFSGDPLSISFAAPISTLAIGFGVEDIGGFDTLTVTTDTGYVATLSAAPVGALGEPEAIGTFSAPAPFTSVTITSANPFAIASLSDVPEPASIAVVGAGLLGLFGARRRS